MIDLDNLVMDDPEAVAILCKFYPPTDEITQAQRYEDAIAEWLRRHPGDNDTAARRAVQEIVDREAPEHKMLVAYATMIRLYAQEILSSLNSAKTLSETPNGPQSNWMGIWFFLDSAMHRVAAISRMFDVNEPRKAEKHHLPLRDYRSRLLRRGFGMNSDKYLDSVRDIRNIIEHFEEYADPIMHDALSRGIDIKDKLCGDISNIDRGNNILLRWYDHEKRVIHILGKSLNLSDVERECLTILPVVDAIYMRGRYHHNWSLVLGKS